MRIIISILAISILFLAGIAQAGGCPSTNVIQDPVEFQWTCDPDDDNCTGTLEIGAATLTIGGDTLTTRAYRQVKDGMSYEFSIPGPTIRMTPGKTYFLKFQNTLPYQEPSGAHNDFRDPNISNIHTHGLHISGESPADDVTRVFNGGECGDYMYEVPSDHMGGTMWYHAHYHGSTYLQVAGGAFGMLIVDDSGDVIPEDVAGMTERLLAIGFLDPGVAGVGGDTLISGTFSPSWTVNGNIQGNLCMPENEWQHWRVLLADRDARLKTLSVGPECQVALLARDGVWRTEAPLDLPTNSIELTGASRADLAVKCGADSTISVGNTVVANVYADSSLPANTSVGPYDNGAVGTTWSLLMRPPYLRDLRNETQVENRTVHMGARTINGEKFDKDTPTFNITAGAVQEWSIRGAANHPFHQHVYHVSPVSDCGPYEAGEFYDTVAANCDVRFDLNPATSSVFEGRTIMHCHILEHEDQGAMGWSAISGSGVIGPPVLPSGFDAGPYPCASGPTVCTDGDGDGYTAEGGDCGPVDCDDAEPAVNPGAAEVCDDGLDNDCDGMIDADDPDCGAPPPPADCSVYLDRESCRADRACRWSNRDGICISK